jgi:hypothetical protein
MSGQRACFGTRADVWSFYAEGGGQINLVLLLDWDLPNLLGHRVLPKNFVLPDAIAAIANGFVFVIEIISKQVFWIIRTCVPALELPPAFYRGSRSAERG